MGKKTGDKSRYFRQRKKKHAKRVRMRALRKAGQANEGRSSAEAPSSTK
ncbi:MAG: hypothetical protein ACREQY_18625 [Candidatus Binatia bacterium]